MQLKRKLLLHNLLQKEPYTIYVYEMTGKYPGVFCTFSFLQWQCYWVYLK